MIYEKRTPIQAAKFFTTTLEFIGQKSKIFTHQKIKLNLFTLGKKTVKLNHLKIERLSKHLTT